MTSSSLDTWTAGAKLARPKTASSRVLIVDHWVGSSNEIRMRPARLSTWQWVTPRRASRRFRTSRRSEEHTSELQSRPHLVCRLLLEKKKTPASQHHSYI